jgi:hypothetical protein
MSGDYPINHRGIREILLGILFSSISRLRMGILWVSQTIQLPGNA